MSIDGEPAWKPSAETIEHANLTAVLDRLALASFEELHAWSVEDVDGFWAMVIDTLGIRFGVAPRGIRGSDDPTDPDWLPGAEMNIVASCLDGGDADAAIVHRRGGGLAVMTIGDLRAAVARFAAGYRDAGFTEGDRIAIAMPMNVEAVIAYLGTIAAGGVVVSIADSFAPEEIAVRLDLTGPVAVVTQDQMQRGGKVLPMYDKCVAATDVPCIVVDTGAGVSLRSGDRWWSGFQGAATVLEAVLRRPADHTNILFSSGTTGEPKAIPWTHTTPIKAAMDGRFHLDIHAGDVVAWPTNLGWMMGPWLIYASLLNGAAMALFDDAPTTRGFIDFVAEAEVTMLGIVPSIAAAWRATGILRRGDWPMLRVIGSTGEASDPDTYAWLMEAAGGVPVIEYCGGTEIGGGYITGTVLHPAHPARFTTAALGLSLRILDEHGEPSADGEVFLVPPSIGLSTELLNRDHSSVYYEGAPEADRQLRRHGDHMARDGAGRYRALGRVDDAMNLGGIKVSSAEIESVVGRVAGVAEVAAVAVPPAGGGPDRLVVFVTLEPDSGSEAPSLKEAMQAEVSGHLNPLFRVYDVVVVDALPRTASHKVMRRLLRSGYSP